MYGIHTWWCYTHAICTTCADASRPRTLTPVCTHTSRGSQEYCQMVLFRHPSIRRIAKHLKTTQNTIRGTSHLIRIMDKPYPWNPRTSKFSELVQKGFPWIWNPESGSSCARSAQDKFGNSRARPKPLFAQRVSFRFCPPLCKQEAPESLDPGDSHASP